MKNLVIFLLVLTPLLLKAQLTGYWQSDVGGCYQIRQNGNEIWWAGETSDDQRATNVFHGTISGNIVTGQWCDLPSNSDQGCEQTLALRIENNRLVKISSSAQYNGSIWTKQENSSGCGDCDSDLSGSWRAVYNGAETTGYTIVQVGKNLTFHASTDNSTCHGTCSGAFLQLCQEWGGVTGKILDGGNTIEFSNGSYWYKI